VMIRCWMYAFMDAKILIIKEKTMKKHR
jgi:hypothetical protein